MKPQEIVSFLDRAAITSPHDRHAWDYETNVGEIQVDHERRTITFMARLEG